jgi:hypothetical protein
LYSQGPIKTPSYFMTTENATTATSIAAAIATEAAATSEKLQQLQQEAAAQWEAIKGLEFGSKEFNDGQLAMFKLQNAIKAEQAAIAAAEANRKAEEARNAKIAIVDNYAAAVLAAAAKGATDEQKAAAAAMREQLVNLVVGAKVATATKPKGEGEGEGASKGATAAAIIAEYLSHLNAGMSDTEARKATIAAGYSRGTTGAVVLDYRRQNGLA